jgi:broad specificity phosphatase PhoE
MTNLSFDFKTTPFFFVRHGETDENRNQRVMGQLDRPLNDHGIGQAHAAAKILVDLGIGSIYSSSLERALTTAQIIGEAIGAPVHTMPGLMERHYGLYQGQERSKRIAGTMPKPDGVESWLAFTQRTRSTLKSIQGQSPILVVAHNGTYKAVIGDQKASAPNATPLQLIPPTKDNTGWSILPIGV